MKFGMSQPVRRVEDARLVTGQGCYTDDIVVDGQAYGVMLRSPIAHGHLRHLDVEEARSALGVVAVYTAAELMAEDANGLPCVIPLTNQDGTPRADPKHPVLVEEKVRYVGDNLAFVVAETLDEARDAAEKIDYDIEELPVVVDADKALTPEAPLLHDDAPGNLAFDWAQGDEAKTDDAFARASHVTRLDLVNNRVVANPMETRAVIARPDQESGRMTVYTGTQGGWTLKRLLAEHILKTDAENVRIVTPDVGGGFGMKLFFYAEVAAAAFAAKQLGRPVRWTGDRSESFLSDSQGRDHITHAELAFDDAQRIIGMRVDTIANLGGYYSTNAPLIPTMAAVRVHPGGYAFDAFHYRARGVFTNTVPVDAYRGAGRPEAIYVIERLMDVSAAELGLDPVELRRRNFIPASAMPYRTASGCLYDSGDFERLLDRALELADREGFVARKQVSAAKGKRRGLGLAYYIEATAGNPAESAAIRFTEDGWVDLYVGTQTNGQGHVTAYSQVIREKLGVPFDRIRVIQGDTDLIPTGGGTGGSRSLTTQGPALQVAGDKVIEKAKTFAANALEVAPVDIEFDNENGTFSVAGTDRRIGIMELAQRAREMHVAGEDNGLDAEGSHKVEAFSFPNGCHIAEVEVDEETGAVEIVAYTVVDDFGKIINPDIVRGQVIGGVAQGIGQALLEHTAYDETGQLLSGSFMDYAMPRADNIPLDLKFETVEIPCPMNPLGVKGAGEAGSVGAPAAAMNAVVNALSDLGVRHVDMPATPEKIWRLIQDAR